MRVLLIFLLLTKLLYSQPEPFHHYETFCELEIFSWEMGGWIKLSPDTCYEFLMNDKQDMFVIQNLSDSTDYVFYKIYETQNKVFDWKYKSRNERTKEDIYLNYTKDEEWTQLRIDFTGFSVRYRRKENESSLYR